MKQQVSPGDLIDLCLRLHHSKYSSDKQFTKFIQKVATDSDLSTRQLARVVAAKDFPSMKTIAALSKVVADVSILDPETISQRLLNNFDAMQRAQKELKEKLGKFKITIVAGWSMPQALIDDNVALTLAENINAGVSYEFIYPSIYNYPSYLGNREINNEKEAKDYLRENLNKLFVKIYKKSLEIDCSDNGYLTRTRNAVKRTINQVRFVSTYSDKLKNENDKKSVLFWLTMPSKYVVLYNLGEKSKVESEKCGSFLVAGKILRDDLDNKIFESKGWLHMEQQEYSEIDNLYDSLEKSKSWTQILVDDSVVEKELS
jgi:hypothetical protein